MLTDVFLDIISGKTDADIVMQEDDIIAFKDIQPQAPFHVLIVPKKRIPTINDVDETSAILLGKMIVMAKQIAYKYGFADDGYRLVFNCNESAGQTVAHIHLHLLAGRKLTWPPG